MTIEFRIFIAAPSEVEEQRKAMFEGLSRDSALTEEQRKEVAAGAGRMASLLPVLAEDRPAAEN